MLALLDSYILLPVLLRKRIMQIILSAIIILSSQGTLDSYNLYIDSLYLETLYADSMTDLQFPALIETPAGSCSCLAGFRGGTSLFYPKKSWKIELSDPGIMNASYILLDAQYRDKSFMRNVLGLMLSGKLGFSAPRTEHVEFYINDVYYGVYVHVERIDDYFFDRNNIGYGPLFKSVDHLGRLVWQPCDTLGTSGFEAKRGSDEYLPLVRSLIDKVNLRLPLSFNIADFLSSAAISLAIRDEDSITKNYFLHLTPDSIWGYYPWDRDASFGNTWNGTYQPEWIEDESMYCFTISPLLTTLFFNSENRTMFEGYLLQTASIMEDELPSVIDSIYTEIRESVYADTMKQGSNEDFDESVEVLRNAIIERAEFIPSIATPSIPLEVKSMTISPWNLQPGVNPDLITVTVEFEQPPYFAAVNWWGNGSSVQYSYLIKSDSSDCVWSRTIAFPADMNNMKFAVVYFTQTDHATFYYPFYSFPTSPERRVCAPTARRSDYPIHTDDLEILNPVRYTSFLWSIPIVNASSTTQDLSFYGFQAGSARLFAPEDAFLLPGDTLYLTNHTELLEVILPGRMVFGDLALDSPAGTEFRILDPSWATAHSMTLGNETQQGESNLSVILSEICFDGECGDWIELCNIGPQIADISGDFIIDGSRHFCAIPGNVTIKPGDFLVICKSYDDFSEVYGPDLNVIQALDFGLNDTTDGISLVHEDNLVFSVMYESPEWPLDKAILALTLPGMPIEAPSSWKGVNLPGTPGRPNPGWPAIFFEPRIDNLWPNPVFSSLNLEYSISASGEILIYDISGRLMVNPAFLENLEGTFSYDFPVTFRPGVYFVVIKSMGTTTSRKFVILR